MATPLIRFELDLTESLGTRLRPESVIVQEDRNLVMSAPAAVDLDVADELDAAYEAITAHRPLPVGRYLLLRPRPGSEAWTYQAVVHDLEVRPTCRPGDVRRSLLAILIDAQKRGFGSITSQPLGLWHGIGLGLDEMAEAFDETVFELAAAVRSPFRLTLLLDSLEEIEEASHLLRSRLLRRASRSFHTVDGDVAVVEVRRDRTRLQFRFVPGSLSGYLVTRDENVG